MDLHFILDIVLVVGDATISSIIFILMNGVLSNSFIIQCTYTSFVTITHHGAWILVKFGIFEPIEFDNVTILISFGYDRTFFEVTKIGNFIAI
jgi:hypothetical protein